MSCYFPLQAWRGRGKTKSGKRKIVFRRSKGIPGSSMSLPCGRCTGCRLDRARSWAVRCYHEAVTSGSSCFVTLTYCDTYLPRFGSLSLHDFQLFMKRLRKSLKRKIRFFHCGEYGPRFSRPHYHVLIFGFDFPDKKPWRQRGENMVYRSALLEDLWPWGYSEIGSLTFSSAAYVSRYILKKQVGDEASDYYGLRRPEYVTMSRRPGIGREWYERFGAGVRRDDSVIIDGFPVPPPRFYDSQFELIDPVGFAAVKARRLRRAGENWEDNTLARLEVKDRVARSRLNNRTGRNFETGGRS